MSERVGGVKRVCTAKWLMIGGGLIIQGKSVLLYMLMMIRGMRMKATMLKTQHGQVFE